MPIFRLRTSGRELIYSLFLSFLPEFEIVPFFFLRLTPQSWMLNAGFSWPALFLIKFLPVLFFGRRLFHLSYLPGYCGETSAVVFMASRFLPSRLSSHVFGPWVRAPLCCPIHEDTCFSLPCRYSTRQRQLQEPLRAFLSDFEPETELGLVFVCSTQGSAALGVPGRFCLFLSSRLRRAPDFD